MLTEKEKQLQQEVLRDPDNVDIIEDYDLGDNAYFMFPILKKYPDLIHLAGPRLTNNKTLGLLAVQSDGRNIDSLSDSLKNDPEIALAAVNKTPLVYQYSLSPKMRKIKQIAYLAVKQMPSIYMELEPELKEDADISLRALMSSNGSRSLVKYISPKLFNNPNFITRALKINKDIFRGQEREKLPTTAVYNLGGLIIHTISRITKDTALHLKNSLMKCNMAINNSQVPGFSKVLKGAVITAGWKQDFVKSGLVPNDSIKAYYRNRESDIVFYFDEIGHGENDFVDLIHELAHKFHDLYIKDGYDNHDIKNLYEVATTSESQCKRVSFPKIGDPLSNLFNYDSQYGMLDYVKTATPEVYFVGMNEDDEFVYKSEDKSVPSVSIPKEDILKMTRCPSRYSSKDSEEFFAEMCVAITINKVRPEQRQWANHFIHIVKKNLK